MRIAIASDIHGRTEGLAEAADGSDLFVCLGDLILFVDYDDPSQGILADLLGAEAAEGYVRLRTANRWREAREFVAPLWERFGGDPRAEIQAAVDHQYSQMFPLLPDGLYVFGNVDIPALWERHLRPGQRVVHGQTVEVGGLRLGFVGGGLPSPMRTPYEIPEEEFDALLDRVGEVDVLFSHIPPALPELTYDTAARRFERGSAGLLRTIARHAPRYVFHGHVHSPLVHRTRLGTTEVVNVGHFRSRRRPFVTLIEPVRPAGRGT